MHPGVLLDSPMSCTTTPRPVRISPSIHPTSGGVVVMSGTKSVLIIEDEQSIRDSLLDLFDVPGLTRCAAGSLEEATSALRRSVFDLIVTDLRLGGRRDGGLQVMAAAGLLSPDATVIVLTAFPDDDNRQASVRLGATYFLEKPADLTTIAELAARHGVETTVLRPADVERHATG